MPKGAAVYAHAQHKIIILDLGSEAGLEEKVENTSIFIQIPKTRWTSYLKMEKKSEGLVNVRKKPNETEIEARCADIVVNTE